MILEMPQLLALFMYNIEVMGSNPRPHPFFRAFLQNNICLFVERPRMPSVSQPPSKTRQTPSVTAERRG